MRKILYVCCLFICSKIVTAQVPTTVYLWEKGSPNDVSTPKSERPRIDIYLPKKKLKNGQMVLICPGGGYSNVSEEKEGSKVARLLNQQGIAAAVLFYRYKPHLFPAPYADATRALRLLRQDAAKYGFKPDNIVLMGFSAGGHLASTVGTQPELYKDPQDDLANSVSARPDRLVLCYPVISFLEYAHKGSRTSLLGTESDSTQWKAFSNHLNVTKNTPPTFLFHTSPDKSVPLQNSLLFASACAEHDVPVTLHVYPVGGHGVGLALDNPILKNWSELLVSWLKNE